MCYFKSYSYKVENFKTEGMCEVVVWDDQERKSRKGSEVKVSRNNSVTRITCRVFLYLSISG